MTPAGRSFWVGFPFALLKPWPSASAAGRGEEAAPRVGRCGAVEQNEDVNVQTRWGAWPVPTPPLKQGDLGSQRLLGTHSAVHGYAYYLYQIFSAIEAAHWQPQASLFSTVW